MNVINGILLSITVVLSVGRNMFSKSISDISLGNKKFYYLQGLSFLSGFLSLLIFSDVSFLISKLTFFYALIYGALLLLAQWCYTASLKNGKTAVCSTIYSLGFIFPTLSGSIFWHEELSLINLMGILTVIPAVIISGLKTKSNNEKVKNNYILPLIIAMLSTGGLGIMQKIQQSSAYPEQKSAFVLIAFGFAAVVSGACAVFSKGEKSVLPTKKYVCAASVGICFACCNLLNTTLVGRLDSALFFPMNNISVILLSLLVGVLAFKEKIQKKELSILALGIISIILLNIR